MVNQQSVLKKQGIFYRAVPMIITTVFFFLVVPLEQFSGFQALSPLLVLTGLILFIDGIVLFFEMFRNLPDAGNHAGAKTGAYLFGIMGIILLALGIGSLTGYFDPFDNLGNYEVTLLLTVVLGITMIIQYISIHPILFMGKRNASHAIKTGY